MNKQVIKWNNNRMKKILVGILIGFVGGLFSSGGGLIAIFCFETLLKMNEKESRALTVFSILPICFVSLLVYRKNIILDYKVGIICALGGMIGGYLGSKLLKKISEKKLKVIFIIFLIISGVKLLLWWILFMESYQE